MSGIPAGVIPPPKGLEKEEPEFAEEDDIPTDDGNPEPIPAMPEDPEKGRVPPVNPPGKPEHPKQ